MGVGPLLVLFINQCSAWIGRTQLILPLEREREGVRIIRVKQLQEKNRISNEVIDSIDTAKKKQIEPSREDLIFADLQKRLPVSGRGGVSA